MCPKVSKTKTKVQAIGQRNKKNCCDTNESKPVTMMRKKKKGEIKHEKKIMKKKAKAIEKFGSNDDEEVEVVETQIIDNNINRERTNNSQSDIDDNNGSDLDISKDVTSAFVQSIIEKKIKIAKNKEDGTKNRKISFTQQELQDDYSNGFINVKKGKAAKPEINKTSEGYGTEGYKLILNGIKDKATEYLNRAIALDHFDIRHYINRSYSQMCTGEYHAALSDIQFTMAQNSHPTDLARMKCREGQIFALMEQYDKAEFCFKDCLNLFPDSATVRCEFMRMKINQLLKLGFPESNIISVLYDWPRVSLKEAIMFLRELSASQINIAEPNINELEDEAYQSDTEENKSNTTLFMEMIDFNIQKRDDLWQKEIIEHNSQESDKVTSLSGELSSNSTQQTKDFKIINATAAKKIKKQQRVNNHAIWIGSLTHRITESKLKRAFSQFGPINSIYRGADSAYAFINFEHEESAHLALVAESVEVDGRLLPVKSNKRTK